MKTNIPQIAILLITAVLIGACGESEEKTEELDLNSDRDRLSYAIALNVFEKAKESGIQVNMAAFQKAYEHVYNGSPQDYIFSTDQASKMVNDYLNQAKYMRYRANMEETRQFFKDLEARDDLERTTTDLFYEVITPGQGKNPNLSDVVIVNYTLSLPDGTQIQEQGPDTVPVASTIEAWRQALVQMKEGAEWKLYVLPDLAYKDYGNPPYIEPFKSLIYDLQLQEVLDADIVKEIIQKRRAQIEKIRQQQQGGQNQGMMPQGGGTPQGQPMQQP